MVKVSRLTKLFIILFLWLSVPSVTFAACTVKAGAVGGVATLTLPATLNIPRDTVPGTVVYDSSSVNVATTVTYNCSSAGSIYYGFSSAMSPSSLSDVYQTGVPGIGVKVKWGNWVNNDNLWASYGNVLAPGFQTSSYGAAPTAGPMGAFNLQLIITGPVGSGYLNLPATLAHAGYDNIDANKLNISGDTMVEGATCDVRTKNLIVDMKANPLHELASVGDTSGDTVSTIILDCGTSTKRPYMTLTDASNPGNRSTSLSLSTDSTAAGVEYQILQANTLVSFGADSAVAGNPGQFAVTASPVTGAVSVPLTIRFIRTGDIVPGIANALVTFTMSYP